MLTIAGVKTSFKNKFIKIKKKIEIIYISREIKKKKNLSAMLDPLSFMSCWKNILCNAIEFRTIFIEKTKLHKTGTTIQN